MKRHLSYFKIVYFFEIFVEIEIDRVQLFSDKIWADLLHTIIHATGTIHISLSIGIISLKLFGFEFYELNCNQILQLLPNTLGSNCIFASVLQRNVELRQNLSNIRVFGKFGPNFVSYDSGRRLFARRRKNGFFSVFKRSIMRR